MRRARGGVPVFRRPRRIPAAMRLAESPSALGSPIRPPGICAAPTWISPRRNVPVVRTTARLRISIPPRQRMPAAFPRSTSSASARRLQEHQPRLPLDAALHRRAIGGAVVLRPGRAHGRPFAGVEHPELDAGLVGDLGHLAAERVNLADDLALRQAADGGVAGHLRDLVGAQGDAATSGSSSGPRRARPRSRRVRRRPRSRQIVRASCSPFYTNLAKVCTNPARRPAGWYKVGSWGNSSITFC